MKLDIQFYIFLRKNAAEIQVGTGGSGCMANIAGPIKNRGIWVVVAKFGQSTCVAASETAAAVRMHPSHPYAVPHVP